MPEVVASLILISRRYGGNGWAPWEEALTKALGDDQRAELSRQIPAARLGAPEDVAAAVQFLAGPGAAYVTGQTLHVNGGMYMV